MKKFFISLGVACLSLIPSCGDDPDPTTSDDPNSFCNVEVCMTNGTLKQVCIDEYTDCVAAGGDKDQCRAFATETCTI